MNKIKKLITTGLVLSLFALSACNKKEQKIVKGVSFSTESIDDEKHLSSLFEINLGNAQLPYLHLPLPNQNGQIILENTNSKNLVSLKMNLTKFLDIPGGVATLPNGTLVPIATDGNDFVQVEINGISGKTYFYVKDNHVLVGFAFSIKQLDGLGSEFGRAGVYPEFTVDKFKVIAGVFTSPEGNQTGIAVFVDLGNIAKQYGSKYDSVLNVKSDFTLSKRERKSLMKKIQNKLIFDIKKIKVAK